MKTDVTLEFTTDQPSQVDRVIFEALQRAVCGGAAHTGDIEILQDLLVAAIRAENDRWNATEHERRDQWETATINHAVAAGRAGKLTNEQRKVMGSLRADKIDAALKGGA